MKRIFLFLIAIFITGFTKEKCKTYKIKNSLSLENCTCIPKIIYEDSSWLQIETLHWKGGKNTISNFEILFPPNVKDVYFTDFILDNFDFLTVEKKSNQRENIHIQLRYNELGNFKHSRKAVIELKKMDIDFAELPLGKLTAYDFKYFLRTLNHANPYISSLNLQSCALDTLPDCIKEFENLTWIQLNSNYFPTPPRSLLDLPKLMGLSIDFRTLQADTSFMSKLKSSSKFNRPFNLYIKLEDESELKYIDSLRIKYPNLKIVSM